MKLTIEAEGITHEVELRSIDEAAMGELTVDAVIGGRSYHLSLSMVEPGVYWFLDNGRSREASVHIGGDGVTRIELGSRRFEARVLDRRHRLERARQGPAVGTGRVDIRAPMPGKVVRILVQDGDEASADQAVAVIEAMKMQNEVRSPRQGIVRIHAKQGQPINAGDVIFSVEAG